MASLTDIRAGLAANLAALGEAVGVQISPHVLSNPSSRVIWIKPDPGELITYHQAMRNGLEHWHLVVEAYFASPLEKGTQMALDELVESTGATSVKAALESEPTLGGIAGSTTVENAHGYAEYARQDGTSVLGCKWNVLVEMNGG